MDAEAQPGEVRFRRSGWRILTVLPGIGLLVMTVFSLLGVVLFDKPWYDLFPHGPVLLLGVASFAGQLRRQRGLPLRLTRDHLELARPDGGTISIDWSDVAVAEVRGRFYPILVVEPVGPDRTRPVLDRWEWGRMGLWDKTRAQRPHEIHVSLFGVTPGVRRLRAELAARWGRSTGETPAG